MIKIVPKLIKLGSRSFRIARSTIFLKRKIPRKRNQYEKHIARMLQFIGETPAQAKLSASKIVALEIEMSKPRLNRVVNNAMGGCNTIQ
jgi:predicted metalloendopeptidase